MITLFPLTPSGSLANIYLSRRDTVRTSTSPAHQTRPDQTKAMNATRGEILSTRVGRTAGRPAKKCPSLAPSFLPSNATHASKEGRWLVCQRRQRHDIVAVVNGARRTHGGRRAVARARPQVLPVQCQTKPTLKNVQTDRKGEDNLARVGGLGLVAPIFPLRSSLGLGTGELKSNRKRKLPA